MYRPKNVCLIKGEVDTNLNKNTFCFVSLTRVVIMDRTDYTEKIQTILDDSTKFRRLHKDPTEERETDLQDYLKLLFSHGVFTQDVCNKIRPIGSNPFPNLRLTKTT